MSVQILPPISRTPGAQDDYPFLVQNPDGTKRDITNDFIEITIGDSATVTIFEANSGDPTKVEKDDPTNGGWTLHMSPDAIASDSRVTRYSVRLTPNATAPSAETVVIGEGEYTIKSALFTQPSFTVTPEQSQVSLVAGGGTTVNVIVGSVGLFAGAVTLAVAASPVVVDGPVVSIPTPAVVPSGGSVVKVLAISTVLATPLGAYTITITGTAGSMERTATVLLTVT